MKMKKCPQCQNIFADEISFCPEDGAALVDEPPTVEFTSPPANPAFVVDLREIDETPTEVKPFHYESRPNPTQNKSGNFVVPLFIGLILGGVLVLATYFIIKNFGEKENAAVANTNSDSNAPLNHNLAAASTPSENKNNNSATNAANTTNSNTNTKSDDGKYNGRVIAVNAYIRSEPDRSSPEIDVLPMDDRIIIGRRENPNSPWYYVTCEHGTSGWMHGNTIEFTK
jgi:Bacterial SH3 domain